MSIITLPAAVAALMGEQGWGQARFDGDAVSDVTGAADAVIYGPPRWRMTLQAPQWLTLTEAGEWEAFVLKTRGRINHVALYDLLRPAPRGTLRGLPYLAAAVAAGASSMVLENAIGTLERGDWLSLGAGLGTSQLVKVVDPVASAVSADANFAWDNTGVFVWSNSGTFVWGRPGAQVTVNFEPPARMDFAVLTGLVWDKPVAYYKQTTSTTTWRSGPNGPSINGFTLDLLEQWR